MNKLSSVNTSSLIEELRKREGIRCHELFSGDEARLTIVKENGTKVKNRNATLSYILEVYD